MSSSDDDFDDDEDDVLLQDFLLGKTQIPEVSIILQTRNPLPAKIPQTQQPNTQVMMKYKPNYFKLTER